MRGSNGPDLRPLYAAGFVTAFGAHGVAATWGAESAGRMLLQLGLLVAVYDLAEILLKPVFGAMADRVGPRPVIVGGLLAFGLVSLVGAATTAPLAVILVRFGQGAAASAFSPAASAAVSRLTPAERRGRAFGRYGSWKGLGYVLGPVAGSALAVVGGVAVLQLVLALLGFAVAAWTALRCPAITPIPKRRPTLVDVVRESTDRAFLARVLPLAASAGALVAGIGFLPAQAARLHAGLVGAAVAASVLALALTVTQPIAGRLIDQGRLRPSGTLTGGLLVSAAGLIAAAWAPSLPLVLVGAVVIGGGVGVVTSVGYASLAAVTPADRIGRTMGTAEMGRELGDAAAPTLVGVVAGAAGLAGGLTALACAIVVVAAVAAALTARSGSAASPLPHRG